MIVYRGGIVRILSHVGLVLKLLCAEDTHECSIEV